MSHGMAHFGAWMPPNNSIQRPALRAAADAERSADKSSKGTLLGPD
jgi:hypothetical protein